MSMSWYTSYKSARSADVTHQTQLLARSLVLDEEPYQRYRIRPPPERHLLHERQMCHSVPIYSAHDKKHGLRFFECILTLMASILHCNHLHVPAHCCLRSVHRRGLSTYLRGPNWCCASFAEQRRIEPPGTRWFSCALPR